MRKLQVSKSRMTSSSSGSRMRFQYFPTDGLAFISEGVKVWMKKQRFNDYWAQNDWAEISLNADSVSPTIDRKGKLKRHLNYVGQFAGGQIIKIDLTDPPVGAAFSMFSQGSRIKRFGWDTTEGLRKVETFIRFILAEKEAPICLMGRGILNQGKFIKVLVPDGTIVV